MLTNNATILSRLTPSPALMCVQRRASKKVPSEDDFIKSNIESFGNDIGQITNWVTSMYEVRAGFAPGSREYDTLTYRIRCGQLYQQNAIDKAKGIISKPMPKIWHDRHTVNRIENEELRAFYRSIVADRKPYFMRYIYPELMKQYNEYIRNTDRNALREFGLTVDELKALPDASDEQKEFLKYYDLRMPVGTNDCVMNRICRRFEEAFDGYVSRKTTDEPFDYTIMKSGQPYSTRQYNAILRLYEDYTSRLNGYAAYASRERLDEDESARALQVMNEEFERACAEACPDRETLCDIILDVCYSRSATRRFAWSMCGREIIQNLLKHNDWMISVPVKNEDGDVEFGGERYGVVDVKVEPEEDEEE